ncbi:MAG: extracellular solute-binding protein [Clostridia bacterium]|nr:extracellular solute-binding protein [Clostridia bacterium]
MKMQMRAIALCLVIVLCAGLFTGCKKTVYQDSFYSDYEYNTVTKEKDVSDQTESNGSETQSGTQSGGTTSAGNTVSKVPSSAKPTGDSGLAASADKKLAKDKVVNMNGYSFTILSPLLPTKLSKNSTLFEELLFQRIKEVEKDYNCKITIMNSPYPDMETIQTYIAAGKKVADLLELSPYQMIAAKQLGYIVPWDTQSLIDKNDARWAASYTKLGYYDGNQYGLQFYRPEEVRYCVVFNKTLLKANGYSENAIYDMVNNGTWTFDKFQEICVKVTKDTNSDGKVDQYGFCGIPNYISWGLINANGGNVLSLAGGKAKATFTDNKVVNALNYYNKWVNTQKVMYTNNALTSSNPWDTVSGVDTVSYFLEGKCAFLLHESWVLNQQVKKRATFDYGMVPYPKGPQASDYSCYSANARLMCLTSTNKAADKTAVIFNALARPVDDNLDWTADVQADYFQNNDKQSIKMYDLCLNHVSYDPGYAVDSLANEMNSVFASTIFGHQSTPSAALQAISKKFDDVINKLFNQ